MKTTKPFSTISYNTNDFLIAKLNKFTENGVLKFWAFINHFPEEDEEKEHTHLYIEPESKMDTLQLANEFIEFIPGDPRPLRWMPQRPSKWDTWYLYDIHDKDYLASIGQSRKYHYDPGLIFTSDKIYLNELVGHIDYTRYTNLGSMILAARNGVTMDDIDLHVYHQANIFLANLERRKLKIAKEKYYCNIENVGNTVSSTIPIGLCLAMEDGSLKPGMKVLSVAQGLGYTWGGMVLFF